MLTTRVFITELFLVPTEMAPIHAAPGTHCKLIGKEGQCIKLRKI